MASAQEPKLPQRSAAEIAPGPITGITTRRRERGRYLIALAGTPAFTLTEETLFRAGLQIGDDLDTAAIARLLADDDVAQATETALHFLAYRARSEQEVRARLKRGAFSPEAIDAAITRLNDWRYLDDADFARRWVESRASGKPRGQRLLQQELRQKGIDAETSRQVIAEAGLDEVAAATALARKRLGAMPGEDPAAVRRKISAYLARRGYGFDVVRKALEQATGERMDDEDLGDQDPAT
ncbi:MAG: RecX family transcriptional regulator [Thermomicrobiales bacterium]|nr:RecX family transcriptional regulator [Thermomicrobiales bacterium]